MKKVLLTNFIIRNFTGSEIDTVTMANCFFKMGYKVDIFTLNYGLPILGKVSNGIKFFTYENADELEKHYDLIWAHHFPLLDYLLFNKEIEADYIHYIALSSFEPYECLPFYYEKLSKISVLSYKAVKELQQEGYKTKKFEIFSNGATKEFFDNAKKKHSDKLNKICVVSNHVPKELYEFRKIANDNGITVDIFGKNDTFVDVTPKLLINYDVIISIGKTINYGLALKIPCFCYDRFGGDLYINSKNIKESHEANFSGRRLQIKKNAQEIYDDIISNYSDVLRDVDILQRYAYDNFCTENQISKCLESLYKLSPLDTNNIRKLYPTMQRKSKLFVRAVTNEQKYQAIYDNTIKETLKDKIVSEMRSNYEKEIARITKEEIPEICANYEKEIARITKEEIPEICANYEKQCIYLINEKNKILNSLSWKITKPLRKISSIIRRRK